MFPWLKIFWVPYTTMAVRRTAVSRSSKSTGTPLVTTLRNEEDRSRWRWSARAHNTPLPSLSLSPSLSSFFVPSRPFSLTLFIIFLFFPLSLSPFPFPPYSLSRTLFIFLPSPSSFSAPFTVFLSVSLSPPFPVSLPIPFHLSLSLPLSPRSNRVLHHKPTLYSPPTHASTCTNHSYAWASLRMYTHLGISACSQRKFCARIGLATCYTFCSQICEHLFDWYTINIRRTGRKSIIFHVWFKETCKIFLNFFVDLLNG